MKFFFRYGSPFISFGEVFKVDVQDGSFGFVFRKKHKIAQPNFETIKTWDVIR